MFVTSFASEQLVGGLLILFDNLSLGVLYLVRLFNLLVLSVIGFIRFIISKSISILQGLYLLIATPILFDFYRYKVGESEFLLLLQGFLQVNQFL